MDERKINELEQENVNETEIEVCFEPYVEPTEPEESKGSLGVVLGVGAVVAAAAVGAVAWFQSRPERKAKRKARRRAKLIEELENDGFTVLDNVDSWIEQQESVDDSPVETDE